ncbi:MAG: hypothetical protein QM750_00120 [Rubrivivax sp.]
MKADRVTHATQISQLDEAIKAAEAAGSKTPIADVLGPRIRDWQGPKDDAGEDVPYSPEACAELLRWPGMATLVLSELVQASSVRRAA